MKRKHIPLHRRFPQDFAYHKPCLYCGEMLHTMFPNQEMHGDCRREYNAVKQRQRIQLRGAT